VGYLVLKGAKGGKGRERTLREQEHRPLWDLFRSRSLDRGVASCRDRHLACFPSSWGFVVSIPSLRLASSCTNWHCERYFSMVDDIRRFLSKTIWFS